MSGTAHPSILLVGNTDRPEFRPARVVMECMGVEAEAPDVPLALAILTSGALDPTLIVIAQAYPGEFSHEAIEELRRAAPLARLIGLMGPWCEGEMRTGRPWPGAIRIYWHQWRPRYGREFQRMCRGETSTWALPVTAGPEERLLALADQPLEMGEGLIAISTPRFDMWEVLADACARRGYSAVWVRRRSAAPSQPVTAAVFDVIESPDEGREAWSSLRGIVGQAPILALADFPRAEDCDRLLAAGAAAVLSKPLLLEDLFWEINRLPVERASEPVL